MTAEVRELLALVESLGATPRLLEHLRLVGGAAEALITGLEAAGEALLAAHGVALEAARCCRSHAGYGTMTVSFEELLVALADKLWKGVREGALELCAIDAAADRLHEDRWAVYGRFDDLFERIASEGGERVASTRR